MIAIKINQVSAIHIKEWVIDEIKLQREESFNKLNNIDTAKLNDEENEYLKSVIDLFSRIDIITASPATLNTFIQLGKPGAVPKSSTKVKEDKLKTKILEALGYKSIRKTFYPRYFKEVGIKTCVYCNSQLTIAAEKDHGKLSAKFDVDHFHSKDDYPFLSISLFNLYPSCASCNRNKSKATINFNLYSDDLLKTSKSEFQFRISSYSKAKYLTTKDFNDLNIEFKNHPDYNDILAKEFNNRFHITGIYQTQTDLVEELIIKKQTYNSAYLSTLRNSFSKLSINPKLFNRILIGNYSEEKDIHKRPMAKFTQDIARQLKLIE